MLVPCIPIIYCFSSTRMSPAMCFLYHNKITFVIVKLRFKKFKNSSVKWITCNTADWESNLGPSITCRVSYL